MIHGNLFLRYTSQDFNESGARGDEQFGAPNWLMLMASRNVVKRGNLMLRGMFSLDRITEGGNGYPLLFQTGETWEGAPLIDRQHPHDLFSELAVTYSHSTGKDQAALIYLGYPGEPALGPPAFMHRPSAMSLPDAPISHHWQDATHITFGVATIGYVWKSIRIDASIFTGREPDENRFDFDRPRFDSYSGRLSINPSPELAFQVSHGFLKSPEAHEPELDINRTSASILHQQMTGDGKYWMSSLVWGANAPTSMDLQNSFLVESEYQFGGGSVFGRVEFVQKPAEELGIEDPGEHVSWVNHFVIGATKGIVTFSGLELLAGGHFSFYHVEDELQPYYGSQPLSFGLFVQLRPTLLRLNDHLQH
jgi:hypothetical protein